MPPQTIEPRVYPGNANAVSFHDEGPLDGDDEYLGWGDLVDGGIEVHHIPATI